LAKKLYWKDAYILLTSNIKGTLTLRKRVGNVAYFVRHNPQGLAIADYKVDVTYSVGTANSSVKRWLSTQKDAVFILRPRAGAHPKIIPDTGNRFDILASLLEPLTRFKY